MGGLFGSTSTQTSNSRTETGPSQFQRPYLDDLFGAARSEFQNNRGSAYFQGPTYAGMSNQQLADNQAGRDFAMGSMRNDGSLVAGAGRNVIGGMDRSMAALDRLSGMSGQNATSEIARGAGAFINNDVLQGQIDAANRDVVRGLTEQQLPAIDRAAISTGGINNSRAGIATGLALRGAQDRMADTAAGMRGAAWSQALDQSAREYQSRLDQLGQLAQGYSGLAGQGMDAITRGNDINLGAFDWANRSGRAVQDDLNAQYDDAEEQWQNQDMRSYDLMKRYQDIVGSQQWGMSGTEDSTVRTRQKLGLGSAIGGLAMSGLGMAGSLGWRPFGK